MSGKSASSNGTDGEGIDTTLLEKRLEGLRDTQESIQGLSLWCQSNKAHSQAIADTWLRILRKSPVEKRLTMFYLANDVVQHAKRKSDITVVNQWAFAVQKATPHVRSPTSVSSAITRIFRIWEERNVYSKDAVADLLSLLNNVSSKDKIEKKKPETYTANAEKVAAFQPNMLISKIKLASRFKSHLGTTFRTKSYCQMDMDTLKNSIKDRQHGQEVIQEMGTLVEQLRQSELKLQAEVEERRKIVETGEIAIVFYENVRSESEIVNAAYKNFTNRVMRAQDAVENKLKSFDEMEKEPSPCPSPPVAAPSPPEDDDFMPQSRMIDSQISGYIPLEGMKSSSNLDNTIPASSSSNSGLPSQEMHSSNATPYTPTGTSHPQVPDVTVSNISVPMPTYNPHQQISSGYENMGLDIQQLHNWSNANESFATAMINFSNQQSMTPQPPQNFAVAPSMQLQMQMQQQNILPYNFPSKFDQSDIGSIPLPPTIPIVENPPLPPQEIIPQYPPLPPQPQNPPLPEGMPLYQQQNQMEGDNIPIYSPESSKPPENTYSSGNKYPVADNIFQSQNQIAENEYQPQNIRPSDNVYPPPAMQSPEHIYPPSNLQPSDGMSLYQSQNLQQEPQNTDYQSGTQSDMASQDNASRFDLKQEGPATSPGFDFEYEPEFVDSHSQKYDRQHHYQPKNYHPYNPSQRNRRPNPGGSAPHNIQPLLSPPNQRFQARNANNNTPRMPRPHGGERERYGTPNSIPSLLESPVSHSGGPNKPQHRPNQHQNFDNYGGFDDPVGTVNMGPNGTGMNDDNFQYDHYQSQQDAGPPNLLSMNLNNLRNRNPRRGFRGGFRGSPRMRGNGPGGPRRGRF